MKNTLVLVAIAIVLILLGAGFIIYATEVRNYFYRSYRSGITKINGVPSWPDQYPGLWLFRFFGIVSLGVGVAIPILLYLKNR